MEIKDLDGRRNSPGTTIEKHSGGKSTFSRCCAAFTVSIKVGIEGRGEADDEIIPSPHVSFPPPCHSTRGQQDDDAEACRRPLHVSFADARVSTASISHASFNICRTSTVAPEFYAWVEVGGSPLPVFGAVREENKTIGYIEAKEGQQFVVKTLDLRENVASDFDLRLWIDGMRSVESEAVFRARRLVKLAGWPHR